MPRYYHHLVLLSPAFSQLSASDADGALVKSVRDGSRYYPVVKADQLEKILGPSRGTTVKAVAIL